jgi:hypothetical protein
MCSIARSNDTYPNVDQAKLSEVERQLKQLVEITGFWSISRKALNNIGEALLQNKEKGLKIVCPICLDGQEKKGTTDIPKLIPLQIAFIEKIQSIIPITSVTFLFATYGKTQSTQDKEVIRGMLERTRAYLHDPLYSAVEMSEYIPNVRASEERIKAEVSSRYGVFDSLAKKLAPERKEYCIRRGLDQKFLTRAINKSISEFMVLGRHAASSGILICIHTTGRIRCFIKAGAGVLHNPIGCG